MVPVTYVGFRESYKDVKYGSGIVFNKGETLAVPDAIAAKMLNHTDVYVLGKATPELKEAVPEEKPKQEDTQDMRDQIMTMEPDALLYYAMTEFNRTLDKRKSVDNLRRDVILLIDQYGIN